MNISALGASGVQALYFQSLLGSSGSSSDDSISSLLQLGTDTLSISSQGEWLSRSQESNPFKTDFDNLGQLIESGDLEGAKKAFAAMQGKMQVHGKSGGDDPMATDFAAIGAALESGDTGAALDAWTEMQSKLSEMRPPGGQGQGGLQTDLEQLEEMLDSGDLDSAKSLLDTIQTNSSTSSNNLQAMLLSSYLSNSNWWTGSGS